LANKIVTVVSVSGGGLEIRENRELNKCLMNSALFEQHTIFLWVNDKAHSSLCGLFRVERQIMNNSLRYHQEFTSEIVSDNHYRRFSASFEKPVNPTIEQSLQIPSLHSISFVFQYLAVL
jgi:hypothetical protein